MVGLPRSSPRKEGANECCACSAPGAHPPSPGAGAERRAGCAGGRHGQRDRGAAGAHPDSQPDLVVLERGLSGRPAAVLAEAHTQTRQLRFLLLGRDPALRQGALDAGAYAFAAVDDPPELLLAVLRLIQEELRH